MLKIAYGNPWKTVDPSLQHTLVADLVVGNEFEALVGLNDEGVLSPLGAKSWTISKDFKEYKFQIDDSKIFSSGVRLSAVHYKSAWEYAALVDPISSNSSQLDVLYMLEGFESLKTNGHISGIEVTSPTELTLRFRLPYRMALDYLEGNRFAAFLRSNERFVGTGRYVISEIGPDLLKFEWNKFSPYKAGKASNEILVSVAYGKQALEKLESGELDVFAYGIGSDLPNVLPKKVGIVVGQDSVRHCLQLNSNSHRLFANGSYRQAFQYLVWKTLRKYPDFLGNPNYTKIDYQLYSGLQAGRLRAEEAEKLILQGQQFVPDFLAATKNSPLLLITPGNEKLHHLLQSAGVTLSENSGIAMREDFFDLMYNSTKPDVLVAGFSVAYGDPDGIYHKLGKNGAIASKMVVPGKTAEMLEQGRSISDLEAVTSFYEGVNRAFLNDVPMVHLGYSKAIALYRTDRVSVNSGHLKRNEGLLHIFEELNVDR